MLVTASNERIVERQVLGVADLEADPGMSMRPPAECDRLG